MSSNGDRDDNKDHAMGSIPIFISNTSVHLVVLQWANVQSPSPLSSKWLQWVQMEMEINLVDHAMGASISISISNGFKWKWKSTYWITQWVVQSPSPSPNAFKVVAVSLYIVLGVHEVCAAWDAQVSLESKPTSSIMKS
jgi:hypothetical protein